ncbi:MAG TPA: hypothetical protein VHP11_00030, partial [Tepidisphaeraceae bacterium]|nr:hypothetical protein [Tepidisphaeraceae bacterium]
ALAEFTRQLSTLQDAGLPMLRSLKILWQQERAGNFKNTLTQAQFLVHELALNCPNPFIREAAYRDHDKEWTIDLAKHTFTLTMHTETPSASAGTFSRLRDGRWGATLDKADALTRDWVPAENEPMASDVAKDALLTMCAAMKSDANMDALGKALKTGTWTVDRETHRATGKDDGKSLRHFSWAIDLQRREFIAAQTYMDTEQQYWGRFGWNKRRQWVAWPMRMTITKRSSRPQRVESLVTPPTPVSID